MNRMLEAMKPLPVPGPRLQTEEKGAKRKNLLLNKSFCRGPGGSFFKKRPLAAGGKFFFLTFPLDFFFKKAYIVVMAIKFWIAHI
jgi:hypothetical protein